MYRNFCFHTGYVEEQSMAVLLLQHETGFSNPKDAYADLARILAETWFYGTPFDRNGVYSGFSAECCSDSLSQSENKFCSNCGTRLRMEKPSEEQIGSLWEDLIHGTVNSVSASGLYGAIGESKWSFVGPDVEGEWVTVFGAENTPQGGGYYHRVGTDYSYVSWDD